MAELGDVRRTERLVEVAAALAKNPQGVLTESFEEWSELKAAYRLFSNPEVTYESILSPHWQRTCERCCEPGEYLLIEDGADLDFSTHRKTRGLGRIGNDRGYGMLLHSTLVARVHTWQLDQSPEVSLEGLLGQACWVRQGTSRRRVERWRERMRRQRESEYWAATLARLPKEKPAGVTWIYLADRESDIYEVFERCRAQQVNHIIRAQHSRALSGEDQHLFETVRQAPLLGYYELELRARPGVAARVAQLEVRVVSVSLRGVERPGGRRPDLPVQVVEVREINAPADVQEPIGWILLTDLPVTTLEEARRVISRYSRRWLIEEYHKALKTGAQIEKSQLETAERLQALLGVLAVVAVRLLNTKLLAHVHPHQAVDQQILGPEALAILDALIGEPESGWTYQSLLVAIARLGGFVGRRGDGLPGWITLWRGMQRLMTMVEGAAILSSLTSRSAAIRYG